ncbi:hypothetical protein HFP89_02960 [Wenzhouxiangella sp. XN79A]|uniref:hypothetical protein n=1 Tax=Wenzhouxiangella sp. XN79A TaxID=2724193 RepID=UPI00144ABAC0|nr:hypothetical protein [Wenzhouxiangella sp. XN79A]NKI34125.1 hypothetical protein [Wenzhouxiangella sp. XN79A]
MLSLIGLGLLAPILPMGCADPHSERMAWPELARSLTGMDDETGRRIGRSWAEQKTGAEALPEIDGGRWAGDGLLYAPGTEPLSQLEARVRAQYLKQETATVDGWVLSRLELDVLARLAETTG